MSATPKGLLVVNVLGTFGYISLILQWLWVSVLFLPGLIENDAIKGFLLPPATTTNGLQFEFHSPPLLATILAIIVTIAVLVVTAVVLIRLPSSISKSGKKATVKSAEKIIPILSHHHTLPAKKKRQLTLQTIRMIKLVLTVLPFLLLFLVIVVPTALSNEIVMLVGAFLGLGTLLWFGLEYGLAHILKIDPLDVV